MPIYSYPLKMAGGIYINQPFAFNLKCVIFGSLLMLFYWFLPCNRNVYLLPALFIIGYILMAWYDWLYDCSVKLYTGSKGVVGIFDSPFKPQRLNEENK